MGLGFPGEDRRMGQDIPDFWSRSLKNFGKPWEETLNTPKVVGPQSLDQTGIEEYSWEASSGHPMRRVLCDFDVLQQHHVMPKTLARKASQLAKKKEGGKRG